MNLRMTLKSNL